MIVAFDEFDESWISSTGLTRIVDSTNLANYYARGSRKRATRCLKNWRSYTRIRLPQLVCLATEPPNLLKCTGRITSNYHLEVLCLL